MNITFKLSNFKEVMGRKKYHAHFELLTQVYSSGVNE